MFWVFEPELFFFAALWVEPAWYRLTFVRRAKVSRHEIAPKCGILHAPNCLLSMWYVDRDYKQSDVCSKTHVFQSNPRFRSFSVDRSNRNSPFNTLCRHYQPIALLQTGYVCQLGSVKPHNYLQIYWIILEACAHLRLFCLMILEAVASSLIPSSSNWDILRLRLHWTPLL